MDKKTVITSFVGNRPEALGAYGYGSGVFRQDGYSEKDKTLIDVIFVVKNLKLWHLENVMANRDDYSPMGRMFIINSSAEELKGSNNITYFSHINENGHSFKYGVVEEQDFLSSLYNWDNFFIAGRFQKPTLRIIGTKDEDEAIRKNKEQAVLVTALLANPSITKKDFFKVLCSLSYNGTLRMYFAENPKKIDNIVNGNYDLLKQIYDLNVDFIESDGEELKIKHLKALKHYRELPNSLLAYLYEKGYDLSDILSVRKGIVEYLKDRNKTEELNQTIDTIKTNGIVRSTPYILAKVKKRINSN